MQWDRSIGTGTKLSLLAIAVLLIGFVGVQVLLNDPAPHSGSNDSDPPIWIDFSDDVKASALSRDELVVVFVYAELSLISEDALRGITKTELTSLTNNRSHKALLLRYSDWDDHRIRSIWKEVGHTKKPFLVVYRAGQPPVAYDPFEMRPLASRTETMPTQKLDE